MQPGLRKSVLAVIALCVIAVQSASATGTADSKQKPAVIQATQSATLKLSPGQVVKLDGFEIVLHKVVPPSNDALGGHLFAEYTFTVTNTTADKELILSNATLIVAGDQRPMVKDLDEIAFQDMSERSTGVTAGAAAAGFIGGFLGPVTAIASHVLTQKAATKILSDDPQQWKEELRKKSFQGTEAGAVIFPNDPATGSLWFKQSVIETASRLQIYVKQGNVARVLRFELVGMPVAVAEKTAKSE